MCDQNSLMVAVGLQEELEEGINLNDSIGCQQSTGDSGDVIRRSGNRIVKKRPNVLHPAGVVESCSQLGELARGEACCLP